MTRSARISAEIARTQDKKLLRLLNLAWWREFFRLMDVGEERKAA